MCTTIRGEGTEGTEPAKEWKSPRHIQHSQELLKYGGTNCVKWLTSIFQSVWSTGDIPDDWRRGITPRLLQIKGSRHDYQSYLGITLLSVPGKVFAHVLRSRVRELLQEKRRIQQSGFTPRRSTVDRIITLNMLQQSRREYNRPLWVAYVDLKAAFDSVESIATTPLAVYGLMDMTRSGSHY